MITLVDPKSMYLHHDAHRRLSLQEFLGLLHAVTDVRSDGPDDCYPYDLRIANEDERRSMIIELRHRLPLELAAAVDEIDQALRLAKAGAGEAAVRRIVGDLYNCEATQKGDGRWSVHVTSDRVANASYGASDFATRDLATLGGLALIAQHHAEQSFDDFAEVLRDMNGGLGDEPWKILPIALWHKMDLWVATLNKLDRGAQQELQKAMLSPRWSWSKFVTDAKHRHRIALSRVGNDWFGRPWMEEVSSMPCERPQMAKIACIALAYESELLHRRDTE